MSSIARIFIVLNLLLAALCLGWASNHLSTTQDWKGKHTTLKKEMDEAIDAKKAELEEVQTLVNTTRQSLDQLRGEKQTLATQYETTSAELSTSREAETQLRSSFDGINQSLSSMEQGRNEAQSRFEQAVADLDAAKEARRTAEEAAQTAGDEKRAAEEALANANRNIADLETQVTTLKQDLAQVETTLAVAMDKYDIDPTVLMVQPDIKGAVVTVSNAVEPGLVGINRGRADGVRRGFVFQLYNGTQYKGTARVETVEDNSCYAVIESKYMDRVVTQGDKAATQL